MRAQSKYYNDYNVGSAHPRAWQYHVTDARKGHDARLTFLQRAPLGHLVLYLSVWTEHNQLVRCSVNSNPSITEEYLSLCNEKPDAQTDAAVRRLNISALLLFPNPCTPDVARDPVSVVLKTDRADGWDPASRTSDVISRRKRSWLFPGTLWCGVGSSAMEYNQLGMFESADKCCREHDHCVHIIRSFTVNYGMFNTNLFTVSHCDCDQRFRQCLLGVNDTISDMVGYSFFNILRVPCFNLVRQKHCTEKSWWGRCKVSKEAPYAVFQKSLSYNTSVVASKPAAVPSKGVPAACIEGCLPTNPKRRPKVKPTDTSAPTAARCRPREPPRGDTFQPRRREGKACRKSRKQHVTVSVPKQQTPSGVRTTPATSLRKRPRVGAQSGTTRVASGVGVSGSKNIAAGLGEAYASLATSKAMPRAETNSTPLPRTTVSNPEVRVATGTTISPKRRKNVQMKPRRCSTGPYVIKGRRNHPRRKPCLEKTALPHKAATKIPLTVETGSPRQLKTGEKQRPHRTAAAASTTTLETPPALPSTILGIKTSGILSGNKDSFWDNGNPPRNANKALADTDLIAGAGETLLMLACSVM
uniref:Phospholipase A2-like central domain-containing protein n=2 Tax=Gadus morhua TaxID=8049 RepID=A0A8C5B5X0_GADMO